VISLSDTVVVEFDKPYTLLINDEIKKVIDSKITIEEEHKKAYIDCSIDADKNIVIEMRKDKKYPYNQVIFYITKKVKKYNMTYKFIVPVRNPQPPQKVETPTTTDTTKNKKEPADKQNDTTVKK
jgi:hypothetical protein